MTAPICENCGRTFCPYCDPDNVPVTAADKLRAFVVRQAAIGAEDDYQDALQDTMSELRSGTHKTGIPTGEYSRHYESESVAMKIDDEWIGWTHWFGGGKYGEPESIEWIDGAYFVDAVEVMEPVMKFTKRGTA